MMSGDPPEMLLQGQSSLYIVTAMTKYLGSQACLALKVDPIVLSNLASTSHATSLTFQQAINQGCLP